MLFLLLMGCLYDKDRLDWVYTQLEDDDGDGYREIDGDCDDTSFAVHPGVDEICDGLDNDCNGDADGDALDIRAWFQDRDQDGYGNDDVSRLSCDPVPTYSEENGDCDDDDADVHPDAEVICGEPGDRNCDGVPEDEDLDQDGWARCEDCDDLERKVNPGEVEVCNEYDDNCDGQIDEVGALETTWYPDADGDGYGDPDGAVVSCARPQGYTFDGGDCDDHDNDINPGESEVCGNDADDNCNGAADGCRLEGELEVGASFVGVEGMGIGWSNRVKGPIPVVNAGDLDGDGKDEIAFNLDDKTIIQKAPLPGTEQNVDSGYRFMVDGTSGTYWGATVVGLGDLDEDGLDDLVMTDMLKPAGAGTGVLYVVGDLQGSYTPDSLPATHIYGELPMTYFGFGAARGAIGDSGEDLLLISSIEFSGGTLETAIGLVDGVTLPPVEGAPLQRLLTSPIGTAIGLIPHSLDANSDGVDDLLVAVGVLGEGLDEVLVCLGPLNNASTTDADYTLTTTGIGNMAVADADDDGKDDLWLAASGEGTLWLLPATVSGDVVALAKAKVHGTAGVLQDSDVIADDLDGNGILDVAAGFPGESERYLSGGRVDIHYGPFSGVVDEGDASGSYWGAENNERIGTWGFTGNFDGDILPDFAFGVDGTDANTGIDILFNGL